MSPVANERKNRCEVLVHTQYQHVLEGTLNGAERAAFAAQLRTCAHCAAAMGEVDEAERDLVLGLLWSDAGGVDTELPDFPAERAIAAAHDGMDRRSGRNVRSFPKPLVWVAFAAAAAALFLLARPTAEIPPDLQARGAETPALGCAVDLSIWQDGVTGRPVLSGDALSVGTPLAIEWTNPPRAGGAFRHLTLVARGDGAWRILDQRAIGVVAEDDHGPVMGPVALTVGPGAVEVCGFFSRDKPTLSALDDPAFPGPRICTRLTVK